MITPRAEEWTTLQKITPVIVGLAVLILAGLVWWLYRVCVRRRPSRRAQDTYSGANRSSFHRRGESAGSNSSTSHLNPTHASPLSLPVHRIRYFFSGMLPVRERRRNTDWNIEGDPGFPRRSSTAYDLPSRRESDSYFTPPPSAHTQNDTPPTSPVAWSPIRAMSRWWASVNPSKGRDYQAVHLLSARKDSKFGNDDDDHPDPASSPPLQNQASNTRNDHTTGEEALPAVAISNGEGVSTSRPQTPPPETELAGSKRLLSLRPNRRGDIVAVEDPSPTRPLPSADVS